MVTHADAAFRPFDAWGVSAYHGFCQQSYVCVVCVYVFPFLNSFPRYKEDDPPGKVIFRSNTSRNSTRSFVSQFVYVKMTHGIVVRIVIELTMMILRNGPA